MSREMEASHSAAAGEDPLAVLSKAYVMPLCPGDIGTGGRKPAGEHGTRQGHLPAGRTDREPLVIDKTASVITEMAAPAIQVQQVASPADAGLLMTAKPAACADVLPPLHLKSRVPALLWASSSRAGFTMTTDRAILPERQTSRSLSPP